MDDFFEDLRRIEESGINDVFTPSCPISVEFFCGREEETKTLVNGLLRPGGHAVLFGDRGIGKTSLANYLSSIMTELKSLTVRKISCSSSDSFSSIAVRILEKYGINHDETITTKKEGGFGLSNVASAHVGKEILKNPISDVNNPIWVGSKIKDENGILVIDEFDTIHDIKEKEKFSLLMKFLSDNNSKLHILLVGISRNITELMGGHASVDRSLTQVLLPRMSKEELYDILKKGEKRIKIQFDQEVAEKIVSISHGLPYFTHSLALEASKIVVCDERKKVTLEDFNKGLRIALENIEISLKDKYEKAIGVKGSLNKRKIIYAAAIVGCTDIFTAKQWTNEYARLFEKKSQQSIYGSMSKNLGSEPDKFILRIDTATFVFSDSRMPCYILLLGKPE